MYSLPQSYNQTSKCKRCISSNAYDKPVELSDKQLLQIERSIINSKIVLPDTLNVKSSISLFPHYKDSINLIIHKLPKNKMDSRKVSGQTT